MSKHADIGIDEVCYTDEDEVSQYTELPADGPLE